MLWATRSMVLFLSMLVLSCISHASDQKSVFSSQEVKDRIGAIEEKIEMNDAIKLYLVKNPPEEISKLMCIAIEKAQPASLPETARERIIGNFRKNVTPEVLKKMISAGLKRNFSAEEVFVISKYDDTQLSDNLRKKNNHFRLEVSSEIRLLLAATSS